MTQKPTKTRYAVTAIAGGLLIAEHDGSTMGIGTREELDGLIEQGVLPIGTVLRAPVAGDF